MVEKIPHHIAYGRAGCIRPAEKHRADKTENLFLAQRIPFVGCGQHLRDRILAGPFAPVMDQLADEAVEILKRLGKAL